MIQYEIYELWRSIYILIYIISLAI